MSLSPETTKGALPLIKNASLLTMKILAMQPDDFMDVSPADIPPSYGGIRTYVNRLMRRYGIFLAVLKLEGKPGWRIIRVADLVTLKTFSILPSKQKTMEEKMPDRIYNLTDNALVQNVDEVIIFATRDSAELIPRGVTAARLTALGVLNAAFQELPDDVQMQSGVGEAVEIRQTSYGTITSLIGNVRTMAQNIYGEGTMTYNRFGFEGMISANDKDLVHLAKRVQTEAVAHAADLTPEGWDAAFATAFSAAITDFDDKRDLVRVAEADRREATKTRIEAGNEIYTELSKICNTGKDVFRETDPAKHEDYVIYDSASGGGLTDVVVDEDALFGINEPDVPDFTPTASSTVQVETDSEQLFSFAPAAGPVMGANVWHVNGTENKTWEAFAALVGFDGTNTFLKVQSNNPGGGHYKITFRNVIEG